MVAIILRIGSLILTGLILVQLIQRIRAAWAAVRYQQRAQQNRYRGQSSQSGTGQNQSSYTGGFGHSAGGSSDPYQVLGIRRGASRAEIDKAYKDALKQYHPDKVATMGPDLQEMAKQRTQEIIEAYQQLKK